MSNTYPDLPRTSFPDNIDSIPDYSDVSNVSEISLVNQIQDYMLQGNFSAAQQLLAQNPSLYNKMINADKLNTNRDIIVALERYLKTDYQQYIETKQEAWEVIASELKYIGEFAFNKLYNVNNMVSYTVDNVDSLFICIKVTPTTGIIPTNTEYWRQVTIKGEKGDSGVGLVYTGDYSSQITYQIDNLVSYNGGLYASKGNNNKGYSPNNSNWWTLVLKAPKPQTYIIASTQPSGLEVGDFWFKLVGEIS